MTNFLPYGRQWIDNDDIQAVNNILRSDWLTTGPAVEAFEKAMAKYSGTKYAVAVSNGTAALHAAMYAAGVTQGDEVIVPSMTFVATANAVVFQGGKPIFVDIEPETLLIDSTKLQSKITPRTKALVAVDYAGQPCGYDSLKEFADNNDLILIADACHSLGAKYNGHKVGTLTDLTVFSFHPVKHITTGEGGMIVTDNSELAERMRRFRNHGISTDHRQRAENDTWYYEMVDLGYNYRLTDIQCALGLSQLHKLPKWIERRREIAKYYDEAFTDNQFVKPLITHEKAYHSYHLYVIQLNLDRLKTRKATIFSYLRKAGIGVNVHYIPVHLHPYYRTHYGTSTGMCPVAEAAYERILSLPMFPAMTNEDATRVITGINAIGETLR